MKNFIFYLRNYIQFKLLSKLNYFFSYIIKQPPLKRKFILYALDSSILLLSIIYSSWATINLNILNVINKYQFFLVLLLVFIPFNIITGTYQTVSKYINSSSVYRLIFKNSFLFIFLYIFLEIFTDFSLSIRFFFLLFFVTSTLQVASRIIIRDYLVYLTKKKYNNSKKTLIYGAGSAGSKLFSLIDNESEYEIIGFLDDDMSLWGRKLQDKKIYSPKLFFEIVNEAEQVLIAIPSISKKKLKEICNFLESKKVIVLQVPLLNEIISNNKNINELRPIRVEDLLGRDQIEPNTHLINEAINNKVILILGAGGSIGSEIAFQSLKFKPKTLILVDIDELSLYKIDQNINKNNIYNKEIISFLGDIKYEPFLNNIFNQFKIDIIFHAAAYKHVPLLEKNVFEGVRNNVFSTLNLCRVSENFDVSKIVLISSDKAVRPWNAMGCSKRICELIFLSYPRKSKQTKFAIVRFGNVLGSSGSVVPLFRKQLKEGGPITLTHPKIVRYFMTISEASQLVIQTSALTKGNDIFLLDMGKPILILDLAKKMINLSGYTLKDKNNLNGDIEIQYSGLRSGEKMYEELLIGSGSEKTIHPLIFKASEDTMNIENLDDKLIKLDQFIKNNDLSGLINIMKNLVPEFSTNLNN